jgi:tetratricopeptide (TPR) repeat protein
MNNSDIQNLSQSAIKASVSKDWKLAIELNEEILQTYPDDIPTLNRLGIAYSMQGKSKMSVDSFKKVLVLDPKNQIAKNNIDRLKANKETGLNNPYLQNVSFIEEPGKSKVIPLVSVGEPKVFSTLNIGEPVELGTSKHKIKVATQKDIFVGYLPDNISHRLMELLKAGYKYKVFMKSVNAKVPSIFIQEVHSSKKLHGLASFPLDDNEILPNLSAGESSENPPLEIFDPAIGSEE